MEGGEAGAGPERAELLELAARSGHAATLRDLLGSGSQAPPAALLRAAAEEGHIAVMALLVERGAKVRRGVAPLLRVVV